ncbi:hypothetical protein X777_16820, partial [Ooceraea biroi]
SGCSTKRKKKKNRQQQPQKKKGASRLANRIDRINSEYVHSVRNFSTAGANFFATTGWKTPL